MRPCRAAIAGLPNEGYRMQIKAAAEPVRLVIWDLDETFWTGTLTEGGITYRRDFHDIVIALARRGIVSSICSKNDLGPVRDVLVREGIWEYFVFPSVNWEPKGGGGGGGGGGAPRSNGGGCATARADNLVHRR